MERSAPLAVRWAGRRELVRDEARLRAILQEAAALGPTLVFLEDPPTSRSFWALVGSRETVLGYLDPEEPHAWHSLGEAWRTGSLLVDADGQPTELSLEMAVDPSHAEPAVADFFQRRRRPPSVPWEATC